MSDDLEDEEPLEPKSDAQVGSAHAPSLEIGTRADRGRVAVRQEIAKATANRTVQEIERFEGVGRERQDEISQGEGTVRRG